MKQKLDIDNWNRKEHFNFFKGFDEPYYGVTVKLDCTVAYNYCKLKDLSFYNYYLHKTLATVNDIPNFKYRIEGDEVFIYDRIDASTTVLRDDYTFGFSDIIYHEDFHEFNLAAKDEIERVKQTRGLFTTAQSAHEIHFSVLPWMDFTSVSQATNFKSGTSCPKVSVGKLVYDGNKKLMAFSVHVHHALVDGYHLGLFFEKLQALLNENS
ncbi:CatA-like O-acetyltransferase [Mucilaginibacter antarcticus]|uniref:CatA-like O-acetyltransferase n=1 Tax=Mucilaginibacter antarcticus TaxID=1855725 RepID=A0ABW5XUR3_9SPHI